LCVRACLRDLNKKQDRGEMVTEGKICGPRG
jgi:hypothetical protein